MSGWRIGLWVLLFSQYAYGVHLRGRWYPAEQPFLFLKKFGIQQTNEYDLPGSNSRGFIYGNITMDSSAALAPNLTLVVVDGGYFTEFFGNWTTQPSDEVCAKMFKKIDTIAWKRQCNMAGAIDFLRRIPCGSKQLCPDETPTTGVIPGYQFTFAMEDQQQPRFWYTSLVACSLNQTCQWQYTRNFSASVTYDIWMVNGHPQSSYSMFEHQFSFEEHDVFEIYTVSMVLYACVIPLHWWVVKRQRHPVLCVLCGCVMLSFLGTVFQWTHALFFARDGVGLPLLQIAASIVIQPAAELIFALLLMLVAKGWTISTLGLRHATVFAAVWIVCFMVHFSGMVWIQLEVDTIRNMDSWRTVPGLLLLAVRLSIMIWFLFELQRTFTYELHPQKLQFYLHFGAAVLVWFVYLPMLIAIGTLLSALWRYKITLSIISLANFAAYATMLHMFWASQDIHRFAAKLKAAQNKVDALDWAEEGSDQADDKEQGAGADTKRSRSRALSNIPEGEALLDADSE